MFSSTTSDSIFHRHNLPEVTIFTRQYDQFMEARRATLRFQPTLSPDLGETFRSDQLGCQAFRGDGSSDQQATSSSLDFMLSRIFPGGRCITCGLYIHFPDVNCLLCSYRLACDVICMSRDLADRRSQVGKTSGRNRQSLAHKQKLLLSNRLLKRARVLLAAKVVKSSVECLPFNRIKVRVSGNYITSLLNTGYAVSMVSVGLLKRLRLPLQILRPRDPKVLIGGGGSKLRFVGKTTISLGLTCFPIRFVFLVAENSIPDLILGHDLLRKHRALVNCSDDTITFFRD